MGEKDLLGAVKLAWVRSLFKTLKKDFPLF